MKLYNDIVEGNIKNFMEVKQFKTRDDLDIVRKIAGDRDRWKELSKVICSVAGGRQCMHMQALLAGYDILLY